MSSTVKQRLVRLAMFTGLGPFLLRLIGYARYQLRVLRSRREFRQGASTHHPKVLCLATTFYCAADCPHCVFILEDPSFFERRRGEVMTLDGVRQILDADLARDLDTVIFDGGEALLNPKIFGMIELVNEHGISNIQVVSNGITIVGKEERIVESGITNLHISIDATNGPDYAQRKGIKNEAMYERVISAIRRLVALRNVRRPTLQLGCSFIMFEEKTDELLEMLELVEDLGLDAVSFTQFHDTSPGDEAYELHASTLQGKSLLFDSLMARSDYPFDIGLPEEVASPDELGSYCDSLHKHMCVDPSGNLAPCCHISWNPKWGNIIADPTINTPELVLFRRQFASGDLPDPCKHCRRRAIGRWSFASAIGTWSFAYS